MFRHKMLHLDRELWPFAFLCNITKLGGGEKKNKTHLFFNSEDGSVHYK